MGARSYVAAYAYVTDEVTTGDDCTLNPYAVVRGRVRMGSGVRIGAHASIIGFNHGFADPHTPVFQQAETVRGIEIGDDVWIGSSVTILDGVRVGSHTILAAGAVVTRDVPDYAVVGGSPARILKSRLGEPTPDSPPASAPPARPPPPRRTRTT
nr:acyltransferase [Deinococcus sp. JMULE3]